MSNLSSNTYDITNTTFNCQHPQVKRKVATTSIVIDSYELSSSSCVSWKFDQWPLTTTARSSVIRKLYTRAAEESRQKWSVAGVTPTPGV